MAAQPTEECVASQIEKEVSLDVNPPYLGLFISVNKATRNSYTDMFPPQLNTISWTQIPATNLDRVQKFYNKIFGWEYDTLSVEQCTKDSVQ